MTIENKRRIAVFFFYDKDGIVDEYILFLLNDLKKNIDELVIVCNGKLNPEGREKLTLISNNIVVRENSGFDVWAYKEGLEYIGWDKLNEYDELVLLNFTVFGPLYPFKEMFDEMDKREIDFWGITVHHGFHFDPWGLIKVGYIPEHIQSNFITIRKSMFNSFEFKSYWENMKEINTYGEAVCYHEAIFTMNFSEKGFRWAVYVDTEDLKGHTHYPLMLTPTELVKNRKCPVIKRKCFFGEYDEFLNATTGEPALELLEYMEKNLSYDTNMIWDNLLRTCNMADIKNRMHLNYITPTNSLNIKNNNMTPKVALIMHIYFEDLIESSFIYAQSMPEYSDIYVTTNTEEKREKILMIFNKLDCNKLNVIVIENRGRDVSSLLIEGKKHIHKYEYVCFAHDKKTTQVEPYTVGESFSYKCFENILGSKIYVENIIQLFCDNPRLGLLTPPPPNHASYFGIISREWGSNFINTKKLAEKLKLNVDINQEKEPIAPLGTMFWFRADALKILLDYDWKYEDFPKEPNEVDGTILHAIERIYPFVAQHEGYYSAWGLSDKFARIEITNLSYMLKEINKAIFKDEKFHYFHHHYALTDALKNGIGMKLTFRSLLKQWARRNLSEKNIERLKKIKKRIRK